MTLVAYAVLAVVLVLAAFAVRGLHRATERRGIAHVFFAHRTAALGLFILVAAAAIAIVAPLVAPIPPSVQLDIIGLQNRPPSLAHPLGTDLYSRDVWSRLVYGARVSLAVGTLGMLVAVTLGSAVGAVAGYRRGLTDAFLMRLTDVGLAVPRIFVLLVLVTVWERLPLPALVVVIGLTSWFGTSRLVRAEVLSLSQRPFVAAARALGIAPATVVFRHVLPNAARPIIVSAALGTGGVMLLEAALSFLGIGVPPPLASWGSMIADARDSVRVAPWSTLAPGLAIAGVVMACAAIADALQDAMDPRRSRIQP